MKIQLKIYNHQKHKLATATATVTAQTLMSFSPLGCLEIWCLFNVFKPSKNFKVADSRGEPKGTFLLVILYNIKPIFAKLQIH